MLGLFGTLNLAARSLQTQMTGVEVSGQNLANVNTTGYSRQRVNIQTSPDVTTAIGSEGTGANAVAIQQLVSSLLNNQIQGQSSTSGYWNAQQGALQTAQTDLNEFLNGTGSSSSTTGAADSTTSSGLSSQLSGLFNAFKGLSASPTSMTARQAVITQAQNLATTFNQVDSQLSSLNDSLNSSLSSDVSSANKLLSDIANLNSEISYAGFTGGTANDLMDAREQDLENLSQLVNVQTSTGTNGALDVNIGNQTLVSGNQVVDTLQTYDAGNGKMLVQTATGGVPLTLTGGSMQGTIDARDGTLLTLRNKVGNLASSLLTAVNNTHNGGFNLNGGSGTLFFNGNSSSNISVNQSLVDNPALIQASGTSTAAGDNSVALALSQLASTTMSDLNDQTFSDTYTQSVAGLGDAVQTANDQVTNQAVVTNMLQTQRSSVSGVNVDEEMTNLMGFQRAYEASAQLVTTINTLMGDTLAMKTS